MSAPDHIAILEEENERLEHELAEKNEEINRLKLANAEATQALANSNASRRSAILEQSRLKAEIRRLEDMVDTLVEEYNLIAPLLAQIAT
jgi:hypothetical protein